MGGKLHGITIQLCTRHEAGIDGFNRPIYEEIPVNVDNVLVGQPTATEILEIQNITGKKIVYWLGIPKGDTNQWENAKVILPAPFSGTFKTVSFPQTGIQDLIPLQWGKNIAVERYE